MAGRDCEAPNGVCGWNIAERAPAPRACTTAVHDGGAASAAALCRPAAQRRQPASPAREPQCITVNTSRAGRGRRALARALAPQACAGPDEMRAAGVTRKAAGTELATHPSHRVFYTVTAGKGAVCGVCCRGGAMKGGKGILSS